jgi:hypothetical protein
MDDEVRAGRGKPPVHSTSAEQRARIRAAMLRAIRECDEAGFLNAIADLGHVPGSVEYRRMMGEWRAHFGSSRKKK